MGRARQAQGVYSAALATRVFSASSNVVAASVAVPFPEAAEGARPGTLDTAFLSDPAKLAAALSAAAERAGVKGSSLAVSLSPDLGFCRFFSIPSAAKRFLRRAVPGHTAYGVARCACVPAVAALRSEL